MRDACELTWAIVRRLSCVSAAGKKSFPIHSTRRAAVRCWGPGTVGESPSGKTMRANNRKKTNGSKGFDPNSDQGLARWGGRAETGVASSSVRDCYKRGGGRGEAGAASSLIERLQQNG